MEEEEFWQIIEMLNWQKRTPDEVVEPAIQHLSQLSESEIYSFEKIMTDKLFQLDRREIAEQTVHAEEHLSVDGFLYDRCMVVAKGKQRFEEVINQPEKMGREGFEPLIYIAHIAYTMKTGKEDWDYLPDKLYETGFNQKGWGKDRDITLQDYINGDYSL